MIEAADVIIPQNVPIDRISPTRKPAKTPQGYHEWRHLLFLHWEIPEQVLRPLIPERLTIDTFEGRAYLGVVPFTMQNIRPYRFLPRVPTASAFHECNVRTYVHLDGRDPGVWFFSLDAASSLAVRAARALFHLPYFRAEMNLEVEGARVHYRSTRKWPEPTPATFEANYTIGRSIGPATPGTLEHFLAERYLLYSKSPDGAIHRGQVHHTPYPLAEAHLEHVSDTLVGAAGITSLGRPIRALYSEGVDVDVWGLERT